MTKFRKSVMQIGFASVMGLGAVLASATSALADTVCNRFGDCWHVDHREHYPRSLGVHFYSDAWHDRHDWDRERRRHWRENHDGRGFWRRGVWVEF